MLKKMWIMNRPVLPKKKRAKLPPEKIIKKVEFPEEIDEPIVPEEDLDAVPEEDPFENLPDTPPIPGEGP